MAKSAKKTSSQSAGSNPKSDAKLEANLAMAERLMQLMNQNGIGLLEFENADLCWKLETKGHSSLPSVPTRVVTEVAAPTSLSTAPTQSPPKSSTTQKQIVSPFVGTFYRAPSPGAEPFVKEGQVIKRGDRLCIIEAMKLMNEIEAEFGGKIVSILIENGQPVEFGEPLFLVEP